MQRLVDEMRIPAENRPAATYDLGAQTEQNGSRSAT
jgi:hypothetical protein